MQIYAIHVVLAPSQVIGQIRVHSRSGLGLAVVNFVAPYRCSLPEHLALARGFDRDQRGCQVEQAEPSAITALDVVWIVHLSPQKLQPATDPEHWYATVGGAGDFRCQPALAQVAQAGDRVLTAR